MSLKLITAPAQLAVSLAEAKLHCRVDGSDEDAWFTTAIKSATAASEHETGRRWVNQVWEAVYDAFPDGGLELGLAPVQNIVSVKCINTAGAETALSGSAYALDADQMPSYVLPASGTAWPETHGTVNAVRVQFTVGYGADSTSVPENAKAWMLMHIGTAYRWRESMAAGVSVTELTNRYHDALLDSLRVYRL